QVGEKRFGCADKESSFIARGPVQKSMKVDNTELEFNTFVGNLRVPLVGRDFIDKYKVKWDDEKLHGQKDGKPFTLKEYRPKSCLTTEVCAELDYDDLFFVTAEDLDEEAIKARGTMCEDKELQDLIKEWNFLTEGLGHTNLVKHRIVTAENAVPINKPERRFPVGLMQEAKKSIDEMFELGVIRHSNSEWCFQLVPVIKKDGRLSTTERDLQIRRVPDAASGQHFGKVGWSESLLQDRPHQRLLPDGNS